MSAKEAATTVYTDGDINGGAPRVVKNPMENGDTYPIKHGANCPNAKSAARMRPSCEDIVKVGSTLGNPQTLRVKPDNIARVRDGAGAREQNANRGNGPARPRNANRGNGRRVPPLVALKNELSVAPKKIGLVGANNQNIIETRMSLLTKGGCCRQQSEHFPACADRRGGQPQGIGARGRRDRTWRVRVSRRPSAR